MPAVVPRPRLVTPQSLHFASNAPSATPRAAASETPTRSVSSSGSESYCDAISERSVDLTADLAARFEVRRVAVKLPSHLRPWHRSAPLFHHAEPPVYNETLALLPAQGRTLAQARNLFARGVLLAVATGFCSAVLVATASIAPLGAGDPAALLRLKLSLAAGCVTTAVGVAYAWRASGLAELPGLQAELHADRVGELA